MGEVIPLRGGSLYPTMPMRIGLTYDLRQDYLAAGHSEEETAEFDRHFLFRLMPRHGSIARSRVGRG